MEKTNKGLVDYCMHQLGLPYWWRNFRSNCKPKFIRAKKEAVPEPIHSKRFPDAIRKKSS